MLELLQREFNPSVTAQDVYNLKAKITRVEGASKNAPADITQRTEVEVEFPTDPALQMPGSYLYYYFCSL